MPKQSKGLTIQTEINKEQKMRCARTVGVQQSFFVVQFVRWSAPLEQRKVHKSGKKTPYFQLNHVKLKKVGVKKPQSPN